MENSPAADGNKIFFDGDDGFAYGLDANPGKIVWKTDLHAPLMTTPIVVGDTVYVGTSSQFYRLRAQDGKVLDRFPVPTRPWRNVAIVRDRLFMISSDLFYDGAPSELLSLDLPSQRLQWQNEYSTGSRLYTVWPYVWHEEVLASDNGHLFAYRQSDGALLWSHNFPGQQVRGVGITPDMLYIGTMHGMIYAFRPPGAGATR